MNLQRGNLNSNSKMNTYFLKRQTACIIAVLHLIFGVNAGKNFYILIFHLTSNRFEIYFNRTDLPYWQKYISR